MKTKDDVLALLYDVLDEINEQLPEGHKKLEKAETTVLFGKESPLDSLGLVNLIVATETAFAEKAAATLTIADDRAFSQKHSPFRTVGSLADHILGLLEEQQPGS